MGIIIMFLKSFVVKYLGAIALEKLVIILLGEVVKRTESDLDDKLFEAVFNKTEEGKKIKK